MFVIDRATGAQKGQNAARDHHRHHWRIAPQHAILRYAENIWSRAFDSILCRVWPTILSMRHTKRSLLLEALMMMETHPTRQATDGDQGIAPERRAELQQHFREFVNAYPFTPQGEQQALIYAAERDRAHAQYDDLLAAQQRDEDGTERALLTLLPYANTAANRERGAWIFHSAILTNDIRLWGHFAKRPERIDWAAFAAALTRFVQRCNADPTQLSEASAEFADLPYARGFQTGMLTPILSALRPDAFFLMNAATRRVVNYFAQATYSLRLTNYPAANATMRHLFAALDADRYRQRLPQLPDADIFAMFTHWLVAVKQWRPRPPRIWRLTMTDGAQIDDGAITLPPFGMGDLAQLSRAEFTARQTTLAREHPAWEGWLRALWLFAHEMREGDSLVVNEGTRAVVGVGVVRGPYYFVADEQTAHRLPVEWQSRATLAVNKPSWRKPLGMLDAATLATLREQLPPLLSLTPPVDGGATIAESPADYHVTAPTPDILSIDAATFAHWAEAIDRKGQAIIYGPPGTGKTFLAERLARHLVSEGDGFMEIVQFHPAYAYEDFIQGIRPQPAADGQLTYPLVPGRFLEFCRRAQAVTGRCVLIIDEINRANLAQVFGELMYLLEYRDRSIPLAGGGTLRIPANARIIGTMNTADRSIALVDHALRRRFAFLALAPNYAVLRRFHATTGFPVAQLIATLQRLNDAIGDPHYALGISYFLRADLATQLPDIWRMEIEPYIEEYFFDQPEQVAAFRWDVIAGQILP